MIGWTDERRDMAKALWSKGWSASQIAKQIGGGLSRNAVIGLLTRAGMQRRSPVAQKAAVVVANRTRPRSGWRKASAQTLKVAGSGVIFEEAKAPPPRLPAPPAATWAPLDGVEPVALTSLRPTHCRWPLDLEGPEPMSCGALAMGGPYCLTHTSLSRPKAGAKEALDRKLDILPARRARVA